MEDIIKHRIIGGIVLAIIVLIVLALLIKIPGQRTQKTELIPYAEPLTKENKLVDYEETWREPAPVAKVNLDEQLVDSEEDLNDRPIVDAKPTLINEKPKPTKVVVRDAKLATKKPNRKRVKKVKKIVRRTQVIKSKAKRVQRPQRTVQPVVNAWVVQLASFADKKHAYALQDRLHKKGFHAFTRDTKTASGKTLTRVLVGPEVKRTKAKTLQTAIAKDFHLHGMIMHYSPVHG